MSAYQDRTRRLKEELQDQQQWLMRMKALAEKTGDRRDTLAVEQQEFYMEQLKSTIKARERGPTRKEREMTALEEFRQLPGSPLSILDDRNLTTDVADLVWAAQCEADYISEFMNDGNSDEDFHEHWETSLAPEIVIRKYLAFAKKHQF